MEIYSSRPVYDAIIIRQINKENARANDPFYANSKARWGGLSGPGDTFHSVVLADSSMAVAKLQSVFESVRHTRPLVCAKAKLDEAHETRRFWANCHVKSGDVAREDG